MKRDSIRKYGGLELLETGTDMFMYAFYLAEDAAGIWDAGTISIYRVLNIWDRGRIRRPLRE